MDLLKRLGLLKHHMSNKTTSQIEEIANKLHNSKHNWEQEQLIEELAASGCNRAAEIIEDYLEVKDIEELKCRYKLIEKPY